MDSSSHVGNVEPDVSTSPDSGGGDGVVLHTDLVLDQLQALQAQALAWKPFNRRSLSWCFFSVNDGRPVDLVNPQASLEVYHLPRAICLSHCSCPTL